MKKLVTLSAIALAGATLGVGSTFGWWADESAPDSEKSKAKDGKIILNEVRGFEIKLDQPVTQKSDHKIEVPGVVVETKRPYPLKDVAGEIKFVQANVAQPAFEKLADELEREAKEFDAQGQPEAAAIQRKLAIRLRETLQTGQKEIILRKGPIPGKGTKVQGHVEVSPTPKHIMIEAGQPRVDEAGQHLQLRVGKLHEELEKAKVQLEAAHQAQIAKLQKRRTEQEVDRDRFAKEHETEHQKTRVEKYELGFRQQAKAGQLEGVARELREIAEQLEKGGHKEQAQALRNQAERLMKDLGDGRLTLSLGDDGVLETDGPKLKVYRRKLNAEDAEHRAVIVHEHPVREIERRVEVRHREHPEEHHGRGPDHAPPPGGPHLGEIHQMLRELHHEIAELREEVRGLRGLLSSEHRTGKRDRDEEEDEDEMEADGRKHGDDVRKTKTKEVDGKKAKSADKKRDESDKKSADREDDDGDDDEAEDRQEKDDEAQGPERKDAFYFYSGFLR